ncbi:hypothetical protein FBY23_0096 [Nocardioides sp. SLBN-35]|nr:hypothetical protein FBY23_0096 [Nocardioides sp. SLBN-35]
MLVVVSTLLALPGAVWAIIQVIDRFRRKP